LQPKIQLSDFSEDYLPFQFEGFWKKGYCFLRIVIKDGKVLCLCCQLPDYTGTSITNAVESVFEHAVLKLEDEKTEDGKPVVTYHEQFPLFKSLLLGEEKHKLQRRKDLTAYVLANLVWVEHYPPEIGIREAGSFAKVIFTDSGEPIWNYISIDTLESEFDEPNLFSINYEELQEWPTRKA